MNEDEFENVKKRIDRNQEQVDMLSETEQWLRQRVNEICKPSLEEMDDWDSYKKDEFSKQANELLGRMHVTMNELIKADNEWHELRKLVNDHYGYEAVADRPRITRKDFLS